MGHVFSQLSSNIRKSGKLTIGLPILVSTRRYTVRNLVLREIGIKFYMHYSLFSRSMMQVAIRSLLVSSLAYSVKLKKEATYSSETSVDFQRTKRSYNVMYV
jgi:hypothetical protein